MDRGKRHGKSLGTSSNKIYMDLKDIIREHALAYLPAKSLVRFQSVCRDWKLQISTPFFAHNQSHSSLSILGLFCQASGQPPSFISFDSKCCGVPDPHLGFIPEPVEVRSSSNGLLCCQSFSAVKAYYICNPVNKGWKKLPKPNADHGLNPATVLLFEPSLLNFAAEYKLICAFPSNDFDDAIEFEIYSSAEGSWKTSGEIYFGARPLIPSSGVHVNNVIYWKVRQGGVLAYDLIKDRSQLLQGYYTNSGTLGNLNGKLCTAFTRGRAVSLSFLSNVYSNTMQMSSHAKMWQDKQVIIDSPIFTGDSDQTVVFAAGDVLVIQCSGTLYLYDMKKKETKEISKLVTSYESRFVPYVNSLVSI